MTGPSYERALADAGVTPQLSEEQLAKLLDLHRRANPPSEAWNLHMVSYDIEAGDILPNLVANIHAARREANEQRARADKAVAEAEALRVERDEAVDQLESEFPHDDVLDLESEIADLEVELLERGFPRPSVRVRHRTVGLLAAAEARADRAEAALAEAQRQAADAERAGMADPHSGDIICPVCFERDFDAEGLRTHFEHGWCPGPSAPGSAETEGDKAMTERVSDKALASWIDKAEADYGSARWDEDFVEVMLDLRDARTAHLAADARADKAEAALAETREALKPFARWAADWRDIGPDEDGHDEPDYSLNGDDRAASVSDLRRAARLVADTPAIVGHEWVKSRLGHGETMCARCKITNREAAVLGKLHRCDTPATPADGGVS